MPRFSYLVKYTRTGSGGETGTNTYRTTCSCIPRVADFLDIRDRVYTPSEGDLVERAGYTRSYTKADGTTGEVTVEAGNRIYLPNGRPGAKKVELITGGVTPQGTKKILSFTFPSFMSVAEIADALGELIPPAKIATTGTVGANEIQPFFRIKGGRTYPIVPNAAAIAATRTDVATTEAEQVTIATTTRSRRRRRATS